MSSKSESVVRFIANLMPLYEQEQIDGVWCARSLQDGTLILPVDESDWDEQRGTVRVRWQGDTSRQHLTEGTAIASLALVRYVEFHQFGQPEKKKVAMFEDLAFHFELKTGCVLQSPEYLPESDLLSAVRKAVGRIGESAVVNALLKAAGMP